MRTILFLTLGILGVCTAYAQSSSVVSGVVLSSNGTPLVGITVGVVSIAKGTSTNEKGYYEIALPVGDYRISASGIGYKSQTIEISLPTLKKTTVNFRLEENTTELNEIVVQAQRVSEVIKQQAFSVSSLETKKFENTTLDVNQILGQTAGVRIRESGGLGSSFNFFLNGLSGRQVKFFLDGQPLENFGSVFNLNNIPANLIERVDIYKGAVPVHLGADALGGAINIVTKQNQQNYLDASYSFGSFNTHRANVAGRWRIDKGFTAGLQSFYNYSDNNYTMNNVETVENNRFVTGDFKRFHDQFESYFGNVEFGFTNVIWADQLLVSVGYGEVNNDVQTSSQGSKTSQGAITIPVSGEAFQQEKSNRYSLRYSKENLGIEGLNLNTFVSYNELRSLSVDTSSNRYNWKGDIIASGVSGSGELASPKTIFEFNQRLWQSNAGLVYDINQHHQLSANLTWTSLERQGRNIIGTDGNDPFKDPNTLDKKVLGLSYQLTAFDKKLQSTVFGKYFGLAILAKEARSYQFGQFTIEDLLTNEDNVGYGIATRYLVNDKLNIKASYEKAYRLPEAFEIFGDGLLILANPNILPESSNNLNLGAIYKKDVSKNGNLTTEVNTFLRVVEDMIFPQQGGRFISYDNVQNILIRGVEAELGYSWKQRLQAGINATYQDVLNNAELIEGTNQPNIVYRQRMYNTPYFFANADISYGFADVGKRGLRLSVSYSTNYVQEFFLNYPSIARGGPKFTIPTQFLHHAGITLGTPKDRYNISLEARNFTNALAFDNFALQKPGRAFFIKVRYFLTK